MTVQAKGAKTPRADGPPRTPMQARQLADEHEQSSHELGARRGRVLRKWAHSTAQAKRRANAGMSSDAEEAWARAEGHRQALADMDVTVPTRTELEAPPAAPAPKPSGKAGGASSAGRSRGRVSRPSPSGTPRSVPSLVKGAADASGVSGIASSGWSIASAVFVGSVALILLMRLVNDRQGGPQVVQFAASGVSRLVDLVVDPVDPFKSSGSTAPPQAVSHSAGYSGATSPGTIPPVSAPALPPRVTK